jgi:high affinity sulfate transporter 1
MSKVQNPETKRPSGLARYLPIVGWLPSYRGEWLRPDLVAGLTIVALLVPEGMAYAEMAGMPPQTVFYIAPVALVLHAIFSTSRHLIVTISSAIAVTAAAIVGAFAAPGSPQFVEMMAMLAILTGVISVLCGLLKLGRIAQFFSESVLTGFVFGLALVIAIKQVPKILGIEGGGEDFFERVWIIITQLSETHLPTLLVGIATLAILIALERYFERIPAALVALVFGISVSALFNLEGQGVEIVGAIPAGLAPPQIPDVDLGQLTLLLPGAFAITLVAFAEAIGPAQSFARKHEYKVDANQELIGLGASNVGAGFFQGFPVASSLSNSAANDGAGAKTQMSAIVAAAVTVLVALFLTPLFYNLPDATLGAIVIVAISRMMKVKEMRRLWSIRRLDFALAATSLVGVLIFDVLPGLLIAVVLSLLALIFRASSAEISVMGRTPDKGDFQDIRLSEDNHPMPGLLVVRPNEGLFFANAASLRQRIVDLAIESDPPTRAVLLDLEMTNELDVPSADMLKELHEELEQREIKLLLSRLHADPRLVLDRSGATEQIGVEQIYRHTTEAASHFLEGSRQ